MNINHYFKPKSSRNI